MLVPKFLNADDIFISYSRRDGALYAAGVADELTQKRFSCFIDKLGTDPDEDLPDSLKRKIQSSRVFVLIGTECASESKFVGGEIEAFKKTGRTILPIDFGGAIDRACWRGLIPGLAREPERNLNSLDTGDPSPNVISFIEKSFRYTRRNQRMLRFFYSGLSLFLMLMALSAVLLVVARKQFANAKNAQSFAAQQELAARDSQAKADAASTRARLMQEKAAQATRDAEVATRRMEEKTRLAQIAEGKASLAEDRQRVAEASATRQEKIATSRDRASSALSLLETDPEAGLRMASQAFSVAQTTQAEDALRRALFESHIKAIARGQFTGLGEKPFDNEGRFGVVGTGGGEVDVIDTRNGNQVAKLTAGRSDPAPEIANQSPAPPRLIGVTFSPHQKYLAAVDGRIRAATSGKEKGSVYLWEWHGPVSARSTRILQASVPEGIQTLRCSFACRILSIAFSPDDKYIAGAGEDGVVWVWETATGKQVRFMTRHSSPINQVNFSGDGASILSAGGDKAIIWNWQAEDSATNPRSLDHEGRPVGSALFSPGIISEYIVTTSELHVSGDTFSRTESGEAWVWDFRSGRRLAQLSGHSGIIISANFSPDSRYIVTASGDGTARVWDWQSPRMSVRPANLIGHEGALTDARFSPDGQYVITSSRDKTARLWKPETGRRQAESNQTSINIPCLSVLRGHTEGVLSATFTPDQKSILTVGEDKTARIWRAEGEAIVATLPAQYLALSTASFSTDARFIVTTSIGKQPVKVWDRELLNSVAQPVELREAASNGFHDASFNASGELVAAAYVDLPLEGKVAVWKWSDASRRSNPITYSGCKAFIRSVRFSHDPAGRYLIAAGETSVDNTLSGVVCIWDREAGSARNNPVKLSRTLNGDEQNVGMISKASFSYDDRYVVAATGGTVLTGGMVLVWDWKSEGGRSNPTALRSESGGSFSDAVFSTNGDYIAAAGGGLYMGTIWRWKNGQASGPPVVLSGHSDFLNSVAFSPDSKVILTSARDGTERLWHVDSGRMLATISGHAGSANVATFSSDGKLILATDGLRARIYSCDKCLAAQDLLSTATRYALDNNSPR